MAVGEAQLEPPNLCLGEGPLGGTHAAEPGAQLGQKGLEHRFPVLQGKVPRMEGDAQQVGHGSRIRGIESGGAVEDLPTHTFPTDDGGVAMKCPTEIAISDRREAELAKNGFMPLVHKKNSDFAAFIGAQSLQKPFEYDDPDATANANLSARLPYLFAICRFAHYLKCIVRDKIGSFKERSDMQSFLNDWITQYVTGDPNASEEVKALGVYPYFRPLESAQAPEVVVGGQRLIMMGSNNYLGLVNDERVIRAAQDASLHQVGQYGDVVPGAFHALFDGIDVIRQGGGLAEFGVEQGDIAHDSHK